MARLVWTNPAKKKWKNLGEDSGIGREHGKFGFAELTQVKLVAVEK